MKRKNTENNKKNIQIKKQIDSPVKNQDSNKVIEELKFVKSIEASWLEYSGENKVYKDYLDGFNQGSKEEKLEKLKNSLNTEKEYKFKGLGVKINDLKELYYNTESKLGTSQISIYTVTKKEKSIPSTQEILNNLNDLNKTKDRIKEVIKKSNLPKKTQENLQSIVEKDLPDNIKKYILSTELNLIQQQLHVIEENLTKNPKIGVGKTPQNNSYFTIPNQINDVLDIKNFTTQQKQFTKFLTHTANTCELQAEQMQKSGILNAALRNPATRPFESKNGVDLGIETLSQKQLEALETIDLAIFQAAKEKNGASAEIRLGTGEGKSHLVRIIEDKYLNAENSSVQSITSLTLADSKESFENLGNVKGKLFLLDERYFYGDYMFSENAKDNEKLIKQEVEKEKSIKNLKNKGAIIVSLGASESVNKINTEVSRIKDGIFDLQQEKLGLQDEIGRLEEEKRAADAKVKEIKNTNTNITKFIKDTKNQGIQSGDLSQRLKSAGFVYNGKIDKKDIGTWLELQKEANDAILKNLGSNNQEEITQNQKIITKIDDDIQNKETKLHTKKGQLENLKYRRDNITVKKIKKSDIKIEAAISEKQKPDLATRINNNFRDNQNLKEGDRVQYIIPDLEIAKDTNLTTQLSTIAKNTKATKIIIPTIADITLDGQSLKNQKCVRIYEKGKLSDPIKEDQINNKLEDISNDTIISIFDKTNAIGGDYGEASLAITRQIVDLVEPSKVNLNRLMQYDRNRVQVADRSPDFKIEYVLRGNEVNENNFLETAKENTRKDDLIHNIGYFRAKLDNYIDPENKNKSKLSNFEKELNNINPADDKPLSWNLDNMREKFSNIELTDKNKQQKFYRDLKHYVLHKENLEPATEKTDISLEALQKNLTINNLRTYCEQKKKNTVILPSGDKDNNKYLVYEYKDGNLLSKSSNFYSEKKIAELGKEVSTLNLSSNEKEPVLNPKNILDTTEYNKITDQIEGFTKEVKDKQNERKNLKEEIEGNIKEKQGEITKINQDLEQKTQNLNNLQENLKKLNTDGLDDNQKTKLDEQKKGIEEKITKQQEEIATKKNELEDQKTELEGLAEDLENKNIEQLRKIQKDVNAIKPQEIGLDDISEEITALEDGITNAKNQKEVKEKEAKQELDDAKKKITDTLGKLGLGDDFKPEDVADKLTKNKDLKGLKDVQEGLNNLTDMMGFVDNPNGVDKNNIYAQQITNLDARAYIVTDAGKEFIKTQVKNDLSGNHPTIIPSLVDIKPQTQKYLQDEIKKNIKIEGEGVDKDNIKIGGKQLNQLQDIDINIILDNNTEIGGQKVENKTTMALLESNRDQINTAIEGVNKGIETVNNNEGFKKDDIQKAVDAFNTKEKDNNQGKLYTLKYDNNQVKITYNNIDLLEPDTFTNSIKEISTNLNNGIEGQKIEREAKEKAENEAKEKAEPVTIEQFKARAKETLTAINKNDDQLRDDQIKKINDITNIEQLNDLNKQLEKGKKYLETYKKGIDNLLNNVDIGSNAKTQINNHTKAVVDSINSYIPTLEITDKKQPDVNVTKTTPISFGNVKGDTKAAETTAKIHIASEIAKLTNKENSPIANISGLKIGGKDINRSRDDKLGSHLIEEAIKNINLSGKKTKIFDNETSLADITKNISAINQNINNFNAQLDKYNDLALKVPAGQEKTKLELGDADKYININDKGKATFKDIDILQPDEFISGITQAQEQFAKIEKEQLEAKKKEQTQDSLDNFEPSLFDEPENLKKTESQQVGKPKKKTQDNTIELDQVENLETGKGQDEDGKYLDGDGPYEVSKTSPDQTIKFIKEVEEKFKDGETGTKPITEKNSIACGLRKNEDGKDTVIIKKEIWDKLMPEQQPEGVELSGTWEEEIAKRKNELKNAINGKDENGKKVGDPQQQLNNLMVKYDGQSFQLGTVVDKDGKDTQELTGYDRAGEGNFQEQGQGQEKKSEQTISTTDSNSIDNSQKTTAQASEIEDKGLDEFDIFIDNNDEKKQNTNLIKNNEKKQNAKGKEKTYAKDDFSVNSRQNWENMSNEEKKYAKDDMSISTSRNNDNFSKESVKTSDFKKPIVGTDQNKEVGKGVVGP